MSKKRFERWNDYSCKVKDNQEYKLLNWEDVVQKLNEQQDTIGEQKIAIDELIVDYKKLEKENEQLKAKIKRLQDIATRTEAEKEEYADLYCKCENELIKNRRRCDGVC